MEKKGKDLFWAYLAWLSVCFIWGTTFLAIRVGVKDLPPMLFAGFRWICAGLIFFIIVRFRKIPLPRGKEYIHIAIPGLLMLGISNGLVVTAEQWLPSGLTALLLATTPFLMFITESLLPRGPKFNIKVLAGLLLGLGGVALIFIDEMELLFRGSNLTGLVLLLIAMLAWIFGTLYTKYKKTTVNPLMSATWQMLIAGSGLTLIGLMAGESKRLVLTTDGLLAFLYLVLIASMLGYGSYVYAISKLPISLVSTHSYVNPVIALFLGWLILDEKLSWQMILAFIIILAGILLVKRSIRRKNQLRGTG